MAILFARIPDDRIGVVIGPGGRTKGEIAALTTTQIDVDTDDGVVRISSSEDSDPSGALKAHDIVTAIGRGFSPPRALRLLRDDTYLGVIDIKEKSGKREKKALWRIRSRVIGAGGRARTRIEELSGCAMSVYGTTVALIGKERELEHASRAVVLLLRGSEHSIVFHQLARQRREEAFKESSESETDALKED